MYSQSVVIRNMKQMPLMVVVEPWAESLDVAHKSAVEVEIWGEKPGSIEIESRESRRVV